MSEPKPQLPDVIPVFPLAGSLLLPGSWLPLHVFEPRYRNMVEDAMAGESIIGMVQPLDLPEDEDARSTSVDEAQAAPDSAHIDPRLYRVGCAGRIEECERIPGGRFLIALVGLTRFRIEEELPLHRLYRRVRVDYRAYAEDRSDAGEELDAFSLLEALQQFAHDQQLSFDLDRLRKLPAETLVNGLATALPFAPAEKQALLEAGARERHQILLMLMRMGVDLGSQETEVESLMLN